MSEELKPVRCGCGGEAEVVKHTFHRASPSYGVECNNCHAESWQFYNSEAEAITAWNRAMGAKDINVPTKERTAKVETVEKPNVYKCGECGQYFHSTAWGSPVKYCSRCGAKLIWENDNGNE